MIGDTERIQEIVDLELATSKRYNLSVYPESWTSQTTVSDPGNQEHCSWQVYDMCVVFPQLTKNLDSEDQGGNGSGGSDVGEDNIGQGDNVGQEGESQEGTDNLPETDPSEQGIENNKPTENGISIGAVIAATAIGVIAAIGATVLFMTKKKKKV